jgi:hypothetical protein
MNVNFQNRIFDSLLDHNKSGSKITITEKAVKAVSQKKQTENYAQDLNDTRRKELMILENRMLRNSILQKA